MKKTRIITLFVTFLLVFAVSAMWTMPAYADEGTPAPQTPATQVSSTTDTATTKAPAASAPATSAPADSSPTESAPAKPVAVATDSTTAAANPTTTMADPTTTADPTSAVADPTQASPTNAAPTDAAATKVTPTDTATATTVAPVDATPTEVAPTATTSANTTSTDAKTTEPATLPELLNQVPAGTNVAVVGADGQAIPLASQNAADAIINGDPMWCPTGVAPSTTNTSCLSSTHFNDYVDGTGSHLGLLSLLAANNKIVPGTIWIAWDYNSSSEGTITLSGLGTTSNYALTIKGGWSGTNGSTALNTTTPYSTFNVPVVINWNADVTLSDIVFENLTTGSTSTALTITTPKNISLTRVTVRNNPGAGAKLHNDITNGTGSVTISSSTFSNNAGGTGLEIGSKGAVTLASITASYNGGHGAYIDNSTAASALAVTATGANTFSNNYGDGLYIHSKGAVTLASLTAENNGQGLSGTGSSTTGVGVYINNAYLPTAPQNVTISGTNKFNYNWLTGLDIQTYGAITLNNVTASSNGQGHIVTWGDGVLLDNCQYNSGTSACNTVTPQAVTLTVTNALTDTNTFNSNWEIGLHILSKGTITTNKITAGSNGSSGAELHNDYTGAAAGITLNGTNSFNSNTSNGLNIYSKGSITIASMAADNNGGKGAFLNNSTATSAMVVNLLTGPYEFNKNTENGLSILSKGIITLKDIDAIGNSLNGISLDNTANTLAGNAGVNLQGTNIVAENLTGGLSILSRGAISINSLIANYNGSGPGAFIDNCLFNGTSCANNTAAVPVTLTGTNEFEFNTVGLRIYSTGLITLNNVTATNNTGTGTEDGGAYLRNDFGFVSGVYINGTNNFEDNKFRGLTVFSRGAITLNNVSARGNAGEGVYLYNAVSNTTPTDVAINGTNFFENNSLSGLVVTSYGNITANNLNAQNNGHYGAYLNNYNNNTLITLPRNITINGTNNFNNNFDDGLEALSLGNITINNLEADQNGGNGARLSNNYSGLAGTPPVSTKSSGLINVTGYAHFSSNGLSGLEAYSYGSIALTNINADSNGTATAANGYGVYLDNSGAVSPKTVVISGTNIFNNSQASTPNNATGLYILSKGGISLNNLNAYQNLGYGVYINNRDFAGATGDVAINGTNSFTENGIGWSNPLDASNWNPSNWRSGLEVYSRGNIILNNFTATNNGNYGVYFDNKSGTGNVTVGATILNWVNTLDNNWNSGMEVYSQGNVSLNNMEASYNGYTPEPDASIGQPTTPDFGYGIRVDNHFGIAKTVTLLGTNTFNYNVSGGLKIDSKGAVSLSNTNASNNGAFGAQLDNCQWSGSACAGAGGITFTTSSTAISSLFNNNAGFGLQAISRDAIAISSLSARWNGNFGVLLDNSYGTGGVTLSGNYTVNGNNGIGLDIRSKGAVTANNLNVYNNKGSGVVINNTYYGTILTTPPAVTINGTNSFNNNQGDGLTIDTYGVVTLNNITASYNSGNGAAIDNCGYGGNACASLLVRTVTLTGVNTFNNNNQGGLLVTSRGAIAVSNLTSNYNVSFGSVLDNCMWDGSKCTNTNSVSGVTISGFVTANNNGSDMVSADGLRIRSTGSISANNITTNWNSNNGTDLIARSPDTFAQVSITLTGTNYFLGNGHCYSVDGINLNHSGAGLRALANGSITTNNIIAKWNDAEGAIIDNVTPARSGSTPFSITMNGVNSFYSNYFDGLKVDSTGSATIYSLTSDSNGLLAPLGEISRRGAYIRALGGFITINGGSMTNNKSYGLELNATGTITLKGVFAYGNHGTPGLNATTNTKIDACAGLPVIVRSYP